MSAEDIALAGSNGVLGALIAAELDALGVKTRLLVRREKGVSERAYAEGVVVDYGDPDSLARALEGSTCVVSALAGLEDVVVGIPTEVLRATEQAGVEGGSKRGGALWAHPKGVGSSAGVEARGGVEGRRDEPPPGQVS